MTIKLTQVVNYSVPQQHFNFSVRVNYHYRSEEHEFDEWYVEAIRQGFVLDLSKNYGGVSMSEIEVKVKDS